MCTDYNSEMIRNHDIIMLDTSAAMFNEGFLNFLDTIKSELNYEEKKIFIPKVVWLELVRAYNSDNRIKNQRANKAISIINNNRTFFQIESEEIIHSEMMHCFADPILLCELIKHKQNANVLFITNDNNLSYDANEINNQLSCKGKPIDTCSINIDGTLLPGYKNNRNDKVNIIEKIIEVPVKNSCDLSIDSDIKFLCSFGIGLGAGILLTLCHVKYKNLRLFR